MENINANSAPKNSAISSNTDEIDVYVLGSFNIDIVSCVPHFPKIGQTIRAISTNFLPGGKGSNQASAASKVSQHVHFTVKLGKDEFASKARSYLASTDINTFSIFESETSATGNAVIMVSEDEKNNMIAIDLGANERFTEDEILSELERIKRSKVFLTQLENNFDSTKSAIKLASSTDAVVILNPAPYSEQVKELVEMVDIITPNETEASDLSGVLVKDLESAKQAATIIHSMGAGIVVITMGADGCLLYDGETHTHFEPFKAEVVDTVGAGDSFNGALAASLAKGEQLHDAIRYASAFASLAVERQGASNMPDDELVKARLNQQA